MRLSRLGSISNQLRSANMNELSEAIRTIKDELEEQRIIVLSAARKAGVDAHDLAPIVRQFHPYPEGEYGDKHRSEVASSILNDIHGSTA